MVCVSTECGRFITYDILFTVSINVVIEILVSNSIDRGASVNDINILFSNGVFSQIWDASMVDKTAIVVGAYVLSILSELAFSSVYGSELRTMLFSQG